MADTEPSPTGSARLPPLTSQFPQWSRTTPLAATNPHNASSDGIPGFLRVNKKCGGEVVGSRSDGLLLPSMSNDPLLHIAQLEQNIRWLHEQHQLMLSSLHQEVELLRQRNRDLQFQLVFSKGGITISHSSSSDSSPDDKHKMVLSPKECNTRTLQVEMLDKEVVELKAALAEANANNAALSSLVDQQKKQLMAKEARAVEADYEAKLDDAERLIRRLRRDNEDQRKEIAALRAAVNKNGGGGNGGGGGGGGGGRHSGRRGGNSQPHDPHRFPPLHSQSYWHHSQQRSKTSPEYQSQPSGGGSQRRGGGGGGVGVSGGGEGSQGGGGPSLPHLSRNYSQPSGSNGNRSRYYSNGNHYYSHRGGEGKYRGQGGRGNRDPSQ